MIATLRQKCQRTRILAAGVDERKVRVAAAASGVEQARRLLGGRAANVGEAVFDAEKIERMLGFAQQGESLRGRLEGDNEIARWLAELEKPQSEASADELQRAAQLLRRWQAADESATLTPVDQTARQRPSLLGAAIAWGLLSVVLAVTVHASWFLGLAASAGLAVWAFWPRHSTDSSDPRPQIADEFSKVGVAAPAAWSKDAVDKRLRELVCESREAGFEQVRAARWSDLSSRLTECRQRLAAYRDELGQQLHAAGLGGDLLDAGNGALLFLAKNILNFQQAQTGYVQAAAELKEIESQFGEQSAEVARGLSPYGYQTPDVETATAQVEDLDRRISQRDGALAETKGCDRERERLAGEESALQAQIAAIFQGAGVAHDDDRELCRRLEDLPRYRDAVESLQRAKRDVELTARDLGDVGPFANAAPEALAAELAECRLRLEQAEKLTKEIVEIQTLVRRAKEKSDLETALAQQSKAQDDLAAQRETDCDAVAGELLSDFLDEQQRDLQQPAVLERARLLFGRVTHGRYRLDISRAGEGEPAFPRSKRRASAFCRWSSCREGRGCNCSLPCDWRFSKRRRRSGNCRSSSTKRSATATKPGPTRSSTRPSKSAAKAGKSST